jgi:hypothetical protein
MCRRFEKCVTHQLLLQGALHPYLTPIICLVNYAEGLPEPRLGIPQYILTPAMEFSVGAELEGKGCEEPDLTHRH